MPLARRVPKRGFVNGAFKKAYAIVNLSVLEARFEPGTVVDEQLLRVKGLVKGQEFGRDQDPGCRLALEAGSRCMPPSSASPSPPRSPRPAAKLALFPISPTLSPDGRKTNPRRIRRPEPPGSRRSPCGHCPIEVSRSVEQYAAMSVAAWLIVPAVVLVADFCAVQAVAARKSAEVAWCGRSRAAWSA